MDFHYTTTSVSSRTKNTRMWAVCKTEKQARFIATHNAGYMQDAEYDMIVIEKYEYGLSQIAEQIQWYINDGENVAEIQQPEFAKGTCNYAYH